MTAPLIAVTCSLRGSRAAVYFCGAGLWAAGARMRVLRPPFSAQRLVGIDGVVIGGGVHIEPGRYAEIASADYAYEAERDELEWRVLERATERGLPVLGICRGAQLLNVFRGGSLFQDIASELAGLRIRRSVRAFKWITIEPGSQLASVIGKERLQVNSLHRQAVRVLGRGLRVCARDQDGIVQAIEGEPDQPGAVLGVQWHPEYLLDRAPQRRLFAWVVGKARSAVESQRGAPSARA